MIITCPDCTARFVVKAELIGEEGRKVRCAKCKHSWFQKPDDEALKAAKDAGDTDAPDSADPVPDGSNVPAVAGAKAPIYLKAIAACVGLIFILTVMLVNANNILPGMSGFYAMFGIHDATDMLLYDVKIEKIESGNYHDLVISGKIANDSEVQKYMPNLRLTILGEGDETLKTINLDSDDVIVEPGEKVDFENRIPRLPKQAAKVVMDLGSSLDLASR